MSKSLVLWVENEPERLKNFKRDVEEDGTIELVICKDAESAVRFLDDGIERISAAILDIESFINPDSEEETKTSFCRVRDCINRLEHRNKIEYFAFTGKGKYLADTKGFREEYSCEIFDKNYQSVEAAEYLQVMDDRHIIARISSKYKPAFELSEDIQRDLLQILMILENNEYRNASVYNMIRKVLDWVMEYCYDIGLSQIAFDGSNLADCSKFLGSPGMTGIVPVYIQRSFHSAVTVSNEGSHRLRIDQDTKDGVAPYLIRSTVFELLNILIWLKTLSTEKEEINERRRQTQAILETMRTRH